MSRRSKSGNGARESSRNGLKIVALLGCAIATLLGSCTNSVNPNETATQQPSPYVAREAPQKVEPSLTNTITNSNANVSTEPVERVKFTHTNEYHAQQSCLLCHRREGNSARISFPGRDNHAPCAGCHTQQFADNRSPICLVCHTDAESGAMRGFPRLSSFGVSFDHTRHRRSSCNTCHRPSGPGFSIPNASNAHATCFQCHSSSSSARMASCGTCHKPGAKSPTRPETARIYAVFSHSKHQMGCSVCHTVRGGGRGNQVSVLTAKMHFPPKSGMSCASCHNGESVFGGDNFSDCKRCHTKTGFKF